MRLLHPLPIGTHAVTRPARVGRFGYLQIIMSIQSSISFITKCSKPGPNLSQLPPTLADLQCPMMKQVPTLAKSSAHCMAIFKYVLHQPSVVNQWSYLNILSAAWQRTLRTANITTWVLVPTWSARGTRVSRRVRRQWQLGALHTVTTRTTQLGTVTGTEMRPDEDLRNIRQVSHQQNFTVSR